MTIARRLAPAIAVMLAATPALAQPGVEDAPPPAAPEPPVLVVTGPMNEDWNNVSHINGHPVKVGERDDYLIAYKKLNLASNPIGWLAGYFGLSVSYAVSPNIAIRGDANLISDDEERGYEFGVTVPIYFKRVFHGPFLEGGLMVRDLDTRADCDFEGMCTPSEANVGPQMMFGWHWTFDSGANVAAAVGAFRPMGEGKTRDDLEAAGYFRVGYAY